MKRAIAKTIVKLYRRLFARALFDELNQLVYRCSLAGLGILNYESNAISGEMSFLRSFLKLRVDGVVIDVGANVGNYSKLVLDINKSLIVYAFEPHPKNFAKLAETVSDGAFYPINAAVSDIEGLLSLYDLGDNDGSTHASLYKDAVEEFFHAKAVEHKVRVCRLGEFVKNRNIQKIDLLKIDVEGNELKVLRGIEEFIKSGRIEAIHFEFNGLNVYSRTYFKDFWDMLPNYHFYRLLPGATVEIERYSPLFCEIFAYQNIVAILKNN
ncbi:MAG: FkbM family methyltransferase [Anaerolineaceae bacterium]